MADVQSSGIAPAIIESCPSRIFLPNPQATEPQLRATYAGFGLNDRQISIIAQAQPKRDYYYQSRLGNRLFDLDLGPIALAFAAAGHQEDQRAIDQVCRLATPRHSPKRGYVTAVWNGRPTSSPSNRNFRSTPNET